MAEPTDPNLEAELSEASLDSALTAEAEHESERDAHQRQGKFYTNENVGSGELDLPEQQMHTTAYVHRLEELIGCRISGIGVGPGREQSVAINDLI